MANWDMIEDYCIEFLHLNYMLDEIYHYKGSNPELVDDLKKQFHQEVIGLYEALKEIVENELMEKE